MLCQNCKRNDARVHVKRIVSGESAEIHLCTACATALGLSDSAASFSPVRDISGNIFSSSENKTSGRLMRCETCGFSFEDISETGRPGCPDCYRVFLRKLRPALGKLHGRAVYKGKIPSAVSVSAKNEEKIEMLKKQLAEAVEAQQFEQAAVLRDEIKRLSEKEGQ